MLVDVGEALQHLVAPAADARLGEQAVAVLHQLVQVAILGGGDQVQGGGVCGWPGAAKAGQPKPQVFHRRPQAAPPHK